MIYLYISKITNNAKAQYNNDKYNFIIKVKLAILKIALKLFITLNYLRLFLNEK